MAASAEQFVQVQEVEVLLRTGQLEHAYEQVQAATGQLRIISESRLRLLRAVTHELRNALQSVELYNSQGFDLFGNAYNTNATFSVDSIPKLNSTTFSKLSDVAPTTFWSPYYP